MDEQTKVFFKSAGYLIEKINQSIRKTDEIDYTQGRIALTSIKDGIEKIKNNESLSPHFRNNEKCQNLFLEQEHVIMRINSLIERETKELNERDADIFTSFLQDNLMELEQIIKEIVE